MYTDLAHRRPTSQVFVTPRSGPGEGAPKFDSVYTWMQSGEECVTSFMEDSILPILEAHGIKRFIFYSPSNTVKVRLSQTFSVPVAGSEVAEKDGSKRRRLDMVTRVDQTRLNVEPLRFLTHCTNMAYFNKGVDSRAAYIEGTVQMSTRVGIPLNDTDPRLEQCDMVTRENALTTFQNMESEGLAGIGNVLVYDEVRAELFVYYVHPTRLGRLLLFLRTGLFSGCVHLRVPRRLQTSRA